MVIRSGKNKTARQFYYNKIRSSYLLVLYRMRRFFFVFFLLFTLLGVGLANQE